MTNSDFNPARAARLVATGQRLFAAEWDRSPALQAQTSRDAYVMRRDREEVADSLHPGAAVRASGISRTRAQLAVEFSCSAVLQSEFRTADAFIGYASAVQTGEEQPIPDLARDNFLRNPPPEIDEVLAHDFFSSPALQAEFRDFNAFAAWRRAHTRPGG